MSSKVQDNGGHSENREIIVHRNKKENDQTQTKGEEEKVWCPSCFDDLWKDAAKDGWGGDDIEEMLENKKKKKINKKKKKNK